MSTDDNVSNTTIIGMVSISVALIAVAAQIMTPELRSCLGLSEVQQDNIVPANSRSSESIKAIAKGTTTTPMNIGDQSAEQLYTEAQQMIKDGNINGAKTNLDEISKKYPSSKMMRNVQKTSKELAIFGKAAPQKMAVEEWYQGNSNNVSLSRGITLLVFWEEWCPHCKKEMPSIQAKYDTYKTQGLQVVGFTKVSRRSTKESVMSFINEKGITFPIAKELDGKISEHFNVSGIPAAAVVKDGTILWRGHPARLATEQLKTWL